MRCFAIRIARSEDLFNRKGGTVFLGGDSEGLAGQGYCGRLPSIRAINVDGLTPSTRQIRRSICTVGDFSFNSSRLT